MTKSERKDKRNARRARRAAKNAVALTIVNRLMSDDIKGAKALLKKFQTLTTKKSEAK